MWWVILAVLALAIGVYVGLGLPGMPGREDRIVAPGREQQQQRGGGRLSHRYCPWAFCAAAWLTSCTSSALMTAAVPSFMTTIVQVPPSEQRACHTGKP